MRKNMRSIMSSKPRERFPGGSVIKSLPANAGDAGSIPGLERSHMSQNTCTKPMHHKHWACALEPGNCNHWNPHALKPRSATRESTAMRSMLIAQAAMKTWQSQINFKNKGRERSQDGGGVGQGEHFLPHKFIKRAFKRRVNSTKQLLNASRGHQAPRKAAQLFKRR